MPQNLQNLANCIRFLSIDAVERANSGHPGMPMGMADVATVLFANHLKFNPKNPNWLDRDRFILSAGHGSMLLYSLLYLTGYEDMSIEDIKNFRQLHSKTCGHPEFGHAGGIETTTGPLGQGIANSVGFAMAERLLSEKFGADIFNHYTYVIAGDGCLMEGISQEAISLAGHLKLNKLIVLFDDNKITIDGATSLATSEDQLARFQASGWNTIKIDGHNYEQIDNAISQAKNSNKPTLIACETIIAKGAPKKAGSNESHGSPLGAEEIKGTRAFYNWNYEPFIIPENLLNEWQEIGNKSVKEFSKWNSYFNKSSNKTEIKRIFENKLPVAFNDAIKTLKQEFVNTKPNFATRKSSAVCLEKITEAVPELVGGSADLTGSNLTKAKLKPITPDNFSGGYVYWGVREHGMSAAMNGMALHGGIRPYGGTFFVFTDYCKPAIRLSALMNQPVIYVMTHDSIGLGEDGPTHQPIEHLASMRAIPNLLVLRPADAYETAECWQIALENKTGPTMLVLTRQNLPALRTEFSEENKSAKGAYIICDVQNPDVTLLASGSEVSLAVKAADALAAKNIKAKVVSLVSWELFDKQKKKYKREILGKSSHPKIAIEAASGFGWEKYIGTKGKFIGMNSFGASAPAEKLYEYFGITVEKIVEEII
ncbi:MAG TPA: transketolase [Alphaproteobacteria bacterium]|nr:transketolase [Alphaproteobacteria bacterium]